MSLWLCFILVVGYSYGNLETYDCPMRQLALEFAAYIQPQLSLDALQEIADALNGSPEAKNCSVSPKLIKWDKLNLTQPQQHRKPMDWTNEISDKFLPLDSNGKTSIIYIYIDTNKGDDSNIGTKLYPFKTLNMGIIKSRSYGPNVLKYIILRGGIYYIKQTINLYYYDSNLIIRNYDNENVTISGAIPINNCEWKLYKNISNSNKGIYSCQLNNSNIKQIPGLRVNGSRGIRCRYPNANPETDGFGSNIFAIDWLPSTLPLEPDFEYNPDYPVRNTSANGMFWYYKLGLGGPCQIFVPSGGYFCSSDPQGGAAATYRIPSGLVYNETILPNSPYYAANEGGIIQGWRNNHWASWMFEIGDYNSSVFYFSKGGFQDGRGSTNGGGNGNQFYVENVFEELDYPTEWYYNISTSTLYYYNNLSGNPNNINNNLKFESTNLKVLFNITGNMTNPVKNISISGFTLRDTSITYLDPHGLPSAGDWALQRQGSIYLDGVSNIIISNNLFTRLDGNSISINRYARNVTIAENEFVWNGDNVISLWGDTEGVEFPGENTKTTMGYDGTNGNQPRNINIIKNFIHEIGIWEKQSSGYFQAQSCSNYLAYNIIFNGPRAGINFNDGLGGNSLIYKNLLFNLCRESGDHGPFNSWDRQPYLTKVLDGKTASTIKAFDHIQQNFMIANYNGFISIDNDDGSCFYKTYNNFFNYGANGGQGMKSNFGGHSNYHYNNIYAYIKKGFGIVNSQNGYYYGQLVGYNDLFMNNTLILLNDTLQYGTFGCVNNVTTINEWPYLGNNNISTPSGNPLKTGLCNLDIATFQKTYNKDLGTIITPLPNDNYLLNKAKTLLWD